MDRTAIWQRLAAARTRCGQVFLLVHHALLVPSIMVPVVVSLFEAASGTMKDTIVGASAATALSLALKLELRAYVHTRTAREYLLLMFDCRYQGVKPRIMQPMREAPLLPSSICSAGLGDLALSENDAAHAGAREKTPQSDLRHDRAEP